MGVKEKKIRNAQIQKWNSRVCRFDWELNVEVPNGDIGKGDDAIS